MYIILLLPASAALGDPKPEPLSHKSPAAVVSIAEAALDPPSPENTKVPSASELTVTECLSNGLLADVSVVSSP